MRCMVKAEAARAKLFKMVETLENLSGASC